jgi:transposase-like protein
LREIVERVVQQILAAEMTEHIGAAYYERSATRTGLATATNPEC